MKFCSGCKLLKSLESFSWRNRAKGTRSPCCKDCTRSYLREHYRQNRGYYTTKARRRNFTYRVETFQKIRDYLSSHPCVDCGEADAVVLEFDHVDASTKFEAISHMIRRQFAWATIVKEIDKCEVRCANCHRRRTAKQQGWFLHTVLLNMGE